MGNLILDINKTETSVTPLLEKTYKNLETSYDYSETLKASLPKDYIYISEAREISGSIALLRKSILETKNLINEKINYVKRIEQKNNSKSEDIANQMTTINNSIIKQTINSKPSIETIEKPSLSIHSVVLNQMDTMYYKDGTPSVSSEQPKDETLTAEQSLQVKIKEHYPFEYDVNGDGAFNMKDVLSERKEIADIPIENSDEMNFDANGDGVINLKDVLFLRQQISSSNADSTFNYDIITSGTQIQLEEFFSELEDLEERKILVNNLSDASIEKIINLEYPNVKDMNIELKRLLVIYGQIPSNSPESDIRLALHEKYNNEAIENFVYDFIINSADRITNYNNASDKTILLESLSNLALLETLLSDDSDVVAFKNDVMSKLTDERLKDILLVGTTEQLIELLNGLDDGTIKKVLNNSTSSTILNVLIYNTEEFEFKNSLLPLLTSEQLKDILFVGTTEQLIELLNGLDDSNLKRVLDVMTVSSMNEVLTKFVQAADETKIDKIIELYKWNCITDASLEFQKDVIKYMFLHSDKTIDIAILEVIKSKYPDLTEKQAEGLKSSICQSSTIAKTGWIRDLDLKQISIIQELLGTDQVKEMFNELTKTVNSLSNEKREELIKENNLSNNANFKSLPIECQNYMLLNFGGNLTDETLSTYANSYLVYKQTEYILNCKTETIDGVTYYYKDDTEKVALKAAVDKAKKYDPNGLVMQYVQNLVIFPKEIENIKVKNAQLFDNYKYDFVQADSGTKYISIYPSYFNQDYWHELESLEAEQAGDLLHEAGHCLDRELAGGGDNYWSYSSWGYTKVSEYAGSDVREDLADSVRFYFMGALDKNDGRYSALKNIFNK